MTHLERPELEGIIAAALAEDIGAGDITSELLIPPDQEATAVFTAREEMVACGLWIPGEVFESVARGSWLVASKDIRVTRHEPRVTEGQRVAPGATLLRVSGPARTLLAGERVALNLMQRACGVATLTRRFVEAVRGTRAVILDTRKTMPGLRALDKYAVRAGGGQNHRMRLDEMVLIKDNHIAACGSVTEAVRRAWAGTQLPIEVECDTLEQVEEALQAGAQRLLLDNMDTALLRRVVETAAGRAMLEASGGVTLENVREIAETGVDFISIGRITHSAPAVDIGLDWVG